MAGTRVKLYRNELNGTMNSDENNKIFSLKYDMSSVGRLIPGSNSQDLVSGYPIAIYSYRLKIIGDYHGQVWQSYGDSDDLTNLTTWNLSNDELVQGLKQWDIMGGTSTTLGKGFISYTAKKNPKHLRAKFGKWKRPPIFLGPDAGNAFYICTHNSSASNNRTFLGMLEIGSWKQFT
tara:strand:- start:390 stop:920 length:531 start_codon:yes stop_codon:yes gene_type:complete